MAQWTDLQRIKRFVNPMQLYEKSEACNYVAEPSLTAGSEAVRQMKFG